MNRLFLLIYCIAFLVRVIAFVRHRKRMPGKQQVVMCTLYVLTIFVFAALQFQHAELLPVSHFLNGLSPQVKMWVDQLQ
ncbi:hypothetical protein ACFSO0_14965 [Brevibacillus sp. GCM10020057]|uniref:hypothetical protein n=1 Tax=Brevibacillus sp. GCM10020057 TaxID=3317327 RepID=UPI00363919B3